MATKIQMALSDNEKAAAVAPGSTTEDAIFGTITLIGATGKQIEGWDEYTVQHSGFEHSWTSALVWRSFQA